MDGCKQNPEGLKAKENIYVVDLAKDGRRQHERRSVNNFPDVTVSCKRLLLCRVPAAAETPIQQRRTQSGLIQQQGQEEETKSENILKGTPVT